VSAVKEAAHPIGLVRPAVLRPGDFSGLRLLTAPGRVMSPRPATERLVERALARLGTEPARVVDVGSGSGALAVAIALRAPNAEVWATDLFEAAVELTRANVARYRLGHRVHVVRGDLLEAVPGNFDLVVANLPYLPERLRFESAYADLRREPRSAVFAPGDGLGPYRRLLEASRRRLTDRGALMIQYRGRVLEATRSELGNLLAELEERALAA
jgi:release factor glutamine methyltransferase